MQYLNAVAHSRLPRLEFVANTVHILNKRQPEHEYDPSAATFALKPSATAIGRGAGGSHATQLVLAGELPTKLGKLSNKTFADLDEGIFRCDGAVCLDADEELRYIRMGN